MKRYEINWRVDSQQKNQCKTYFDWVLHDALIQWQNDTGFSFQQAAKEFAAFSIRIH